MKQKTNPPDNGILKNEFQDELSTEDCVDKALEDYINQAQELWNDSCTSYRKKELNKD